MDTAADHCCKKMRFHILTDGRDVHENTSLGFVEQLEKDLLALQKWGCDARIASGGGRMFVTMDRNNVWTTYPQPLLDKDPLLNLVGWDVIYT